MNTPIKFTAKSRIALIQAVQKVFPEDNITIVEMIKKLPNGKHTITVREVEKEEISHMHGNYYMVKGTMVQIIEHMDGDIRTNPPLNIEHTHLLREYITKAGKTETLLN